VVEAGVYPTMMATTRRFSSTLMVTSTLGLGVALTTGVADSDTGALTAGDIEALSIAYA
jgi:hypothetical protein